MRHESSAQKYQKFAGYLSQYMFHSFSISQNTVLHDLNLGIRMSWLLNFNSWNVQRLMLKEAFDFSNGHHVALYCRPKHNSRWAVPTVANLRSNHQHGDPIHDSVWLKSKILAKGLRKYMKSGGIRDMNLFCLQLYTRVCIIKVFGLDDIAVCIALVCPNSIHWGHRQPVRTNRVK